MLVRISKQLVGEVENSITEMRNAELQRIPSAEYLTVSTTDPLHAELLEVAVATAWGKAPELRGTMPDDWKVWSKHGIDLHYSGGMHVKIDMGRATVGMPPGTGYYSPDVFSGKCDTEVRHPFLDSLLANAIESKEAKEACVKKYGEIKAQIVSFLESMPSLNKALETYPELAMYIPDRYIERVNTKTERTKGAAKGAEVPTINVEAMVAAAVQHRLMAGGV